MTRARTPPCGPPRRADGRWGRRSRARGGARRSGARGSWLPGRERETALGHARVGVDGEDPQRRVRTRDGAGLADGLAQARGADRVRLAEQRTLIGARRAELLGAQAQRGGGRGELVELGGEDEPHAARVGERLAERDAGAPGAALDKLGGEDGGAHRAAAALAAGEQPVDQQAERALELRARGRLGQVEPLLQALGRLAGAQRSITPAREVPGQRTRGAEAVGEVGARQLGQLAEGADAEALEHDGQRGGLLAHAQEADRQRGQVGGQPGGPVRGELGPARARLRGRREGGEARGRGADASRRAERPARGGDDVLDPAAVDRPQAARVEPRDAGAAGLDRRADALEPAEQAIPFVGRARGIGSDEPQRRAARQRLPEPQPGADAERLGGGGDLADALLAPRLRRERHGAGGERLPAAGGDGELEARDEDADDHLIEHMFPSAPADIQPPAAKLFRPKVWAAYLTVSRLT